MVEFIFEKVMAKYDAREQAIGPELVREFEKVIALRAVDSKCRITSYNVCYTKLLRIFVYQFVC